MSDPADSEMLRQQMKEGVRLLTDGGKFNLISSDGVEEAVRVLKRFQQAASSRGASLRAVATSAVREARNGQSVVIDHTADQWIIVLLTSRDSWHQCRLENDLVVCFRWDRADLRSASQGAVSLPASTLPCRQVPAAIKCWKGPFFCRFCLAVSKIRPVCGISEIR